MYKRSCSSEPQDSQSGSSPNSVRPPTLDGGPEAATEDGPPLDTVPEESTGQTSTVSTDPKELRNTSLRRGQYRIVFTVAAEGEAQRLEGKTKAIDTGDEYKRVHFYKVDAQPLDQTDGQGRPLTRITAVVHVLDNPLPLVPIAWGAAALVGVGGGSYLLFSSAESFVEESGSDVVFIAASIFSIMLGVKTLL